MAETPVAVAGFRFLIAQITKYYEWHDAMNEAIPNYHLTHNSRAAFSISKQLLCR